MLNVRRLLASTLHQCPLRPSRRQTTDNAPWKRPSLASSKTCSNKGMGGAEAAKRLSTTMPQVRDLYAHTNLQLSINKQRNVDIDITMPRAICWSAPGGSLSTSSWPVEPQALHERALCQHMKAFMDNKGPATIKVEDKG